MLSKESRNRADDCRRLSALRLCAEQSRQHGQPREDVSLDKPTTSRSKYHQFLCSHYRSLIEESIKSLANQGACKMPYLPVETAEMLSFLKNEPPIECGNENDDWVACHVSARLYPVPYTLS